ncbi:MAG: hypothetical protein KDA73_05620 [Rhodobacteraceae bacterium]|nr:hypothetical protein [Paracoccaceae bacterium]
MNQTGIALRNLDPQRGGRAELTIDAPEIMPARLSVAIRRGTQNKGFLGPSGWQQSEHLFMAESFREEGGKLVLVLGPDVVDNELRDFDVVEMTFPEVGMVGQVAWEGITRSVQLSEIVPEPKTPRAPAGASSGTGDPAGTAGTGGSTTGTPGGASSGTETGTPTGPGGDTGGPGGGTTGPVEPPAKSGLPRWLLIAAVLLVVLVAGALAYLKPWEKDEIAQTEEGQTETTQDAESVPPATAEDATPEETAPDTETAEPATPPAEEPDGTAPPTDPMQAAYERGRAAITAGDCATAKSELQSGLDAGYGPTVLLWAEQQDSADFTPCLSETSNDVRALDNYRKACEAKVPEAKAALQVLLDDLQRRADEGDPVAEDVLRIATPKAVAACSE